MFDFLENVAEIAIGCVAGSAVYDYAASGKAKEHAKLARDYADAAAASAKAKWAALKAKRAEVKAV